MLTKVDHSLSPKAPKHYRIGIDVGLYSVGLAAIEVDDLGKPTRILALVSRIHDSGVLEQKTATTRLAAAGVARRTRRLLRRRVKRLRALDAAFAEFGWPEPEPDGDPYAPWRARARLATEPILDEQERNRLLVSALRHMARHRGWRNPYTSIGSLMKVSPASDVFVGFKKRVEQRTGRVLSQDSTVAELAVTAVDADPTIPLRHGKSGRNRPGKTRADKEFSFIGGKLMQSDNANEIHTYARVQKLDDALAHKLIELVFAAESPKGSYLARIGKDPLNNQPRAAKATDTFQRSRIASVLANVRVASADGSRSLTTQERSGAYSLLINAKAGDQPTWKDVAQAIGVGRASLTGTASLDEDAGERLPLRPPVHVTDHNISQAPKSLSRLSGWWTTADTQARDAMVSLLVDGIHDESTLGGVSAWELLQQLDEDEQAALDGLSLPAGRAAYSLESLQALTDLLLGQVVDLHQARKMAFGVDDSWVPPSEPIGAPIGNPAVDRVTKIVARFLAAADHEWGAPERITIEHVRDAFVSAGGQRERDREMQRRFKANDDRVRKFLERKTGETIHSRLRSSDVRRLDAITRQNAQCAYCGDTITFTTTELDHIVPRKGPGSTNTRTNLVAVCIPCNRAKGNTPFARWASESPRPAVSVEDAVARTRHWNRDNGLSSKSWAIFLKEVRERLERTDSDPEIDGRSMESVAWMANELRDRIAAEFGPYGTKVGVYRGAVTAGAREAAGIAQKIPFIGGGGKTRLDRRHHSVDAAVLTLLDESIARTLSERSNMRTANQLVPRESRDWRQYFGNSPRAKERFALWRGQMEALAQLLVQHFDEDRAVVQTDLRLRLGNGRVHDDTVRPFTVHKPVSSAFTRDEIDAASSPAMWTALTRDPDFDPQEGLPVNPSRTLRVHGTHYGPSDALELFDKPRAAIPVRGGWAELGDSIHHARIYRWEEKGRTKFGMLRVFAADLARHKDEDLFSVEPLPSWISMRAADQSIGRANLREKEYLGWLVPGDELLVDVEAVAGQTAQFLRALDLEGAQRWRIRGFGDPSKLTLAPAYLAGEGFEPLLRVRPDLVGVGQEAKTVFAKGWRPSVQVFFGKGHPVVVRRDSLGRPRLISKSGLPVCWRTA